MARKGKIGGWLKAQTGKQRKNKTIKAPKDGTIRARDGWIGATRHDGSRLTKVPTGKRREVRRGKNADAKKARRNNRAR